MYLTLGFLAAGLFFVAILPLLQRRAERLTQRRLESRMPLSFDQIDAQHSMVLARTAVRERQMEQKLETLDAARTQAMVDAGRRLCQADRLEERLNASSRDVARLEKEAAARAQDLAETRTRLQGALTEVEALRLEKDALAREFETLSARLDAYETRHAVEPDAGALAKTGVAREAFSDAFPAGADGWDDWADQAALEPLARIDAFDFVRRHTGRAEPGVADLVDVLGATPLSLELAAAQCRRMGTPISAYAANARLIIASAPGQLGAPAGLAAAFSLSVGAARRLSETAERLVAFLGLCAGERAPLLLLDGVDRDAAETRAAVHILTDLALAIPGSFSDGVPALRMRPAIHALARERAHRLLGYEAVAESLVARLSEIYPADAFGCPESRPLCAKLTPHLVEVCATERLRTEFNEARAGLLVRAGDYRLVLGDHPGAEALFASALSIREKLYGTNHPETAASLDNLAAARSARGDYAEACDLLERSRRIFETTFGLDYPATGRRQIACARLLLKLGQAQEALTLAEGALGRLKAEGRARHPWTIEAVFVVADALDALGKKKRAALLREEFSGLVTLPKAEGLAEPLLERLNGLLWGRGYAARHHH